jgi:hypothetical protein
MARGNILLDILLMEGHQNLVVRYLIVFCAAQWPPGRRIMSLLQDLSTE